MDLSIMEICTRRSKISFHLGKQQKSLKLLTKQMVPNGLPASEPYRSSPSPSSLSSSSSSSSSMTSTARSDPFESTRNHSNDMDGDDGNQQKRKKVYIIISWDAARQILIANPQKGLAKVQNWLSALQSEMFGVCVSVFLARRQICATSSL